MSVGSIEDLQHQVTTLYKLVEELTIRVAKLEASEWKHKEEIKELRNELRLEQYNTKYTSGYTSHELR